MWDDSLIHWLFLNYLLDNHQKHMCLLTIISHDSVKRSKIGYFLSRWPISCLLQEQEEVFGQELFCVFVRLKSVIFPLQQNGWISGGWSGRLGHRGQTGWKSAAQRAESALQQRQNIREFLLILMLILNVPILFIYFLKLTQQQAASCEWGLVTYTTIAIAITHNSGESSNLVGKTQKFQKTFAANFELQEDLFGCDTPLLTPTPIPPTTNQVIPPFPLISPPLL